MYQSKGRNVAECQRKIHTDTPSPRYPDTFFPPIKGKTLTLESLLTDSLLEGIFIFDADQRLVRMNSSGERILGKSESTSSGKLASVIFDKSPEISGLVSAALEEARAVVQSGLTLTSADGKKFNLSVSVSPLLRSDGSLEGAALLIRDETLLKELDRSQRRADQLATLGVLNVGMPVFLCPQSILSYTKIALTKKQQNFKS